MCVCVCVCVCVCFAVPGMLTNRAFSDWKKIIGGNTKGEPREASVPVCAAAPQDFRQQG